MCAAQQTGMHTINFSNVKVEAVPVEWYTRWLSYSSATQETLVWSLLRALNVCMHMRNTTQTHAHSNACTHKHTHKHVHARTHTYCKLEASMLAEVVTLLVNDEDR